MLHGDVVSIIGETNGFNAKVPERCTRSFSELRAESRRLHLELLRNIIDLSLTMAEFSAARPQSESLRSTTVGMARKGYRTVLKIWPKTSPLQTAFAELNPRLDELRQAIGDSATPICIAPAAAPKIPKPAAMPHIQDHLTSREIQVLQCIADGHSTKETAYRLGMSFKTAACHRYRIMDKLAIHETAGLVRYAVRAGLVEP